MSRSDSVSRAAEGSTLVYVTPATSLLPAEPSMRTRISHRSPRSSATPSGTGARVHSQAPLPLDPVGRGLHALVLPDVQRCPAQRGQRAVLLAVALHVAVQLRLPPLPVVSRHHPVLRTSVPETAVDE